MMDTGNTMGTNNMMDTSNTMEDRRLFRRAFVTGISKKQKDVYELEYDSQQADTYEKKFAKLDGGRISWNWCAFIVTPLWLLYRKMYRWFIAYMAISFGIDGLLSVVGTVAGLDEEGLGMKSASLLLGLALAIVGGLLGDRLYLKKIDGFFGEPDREQVVKRYGGTTWKGIIIYAAVMFLFILMLSLFFWAGSFV